MGWGCVICFHCQIKFERSFSKQPYEGRNEIIALKIEDFQGNYLISTLVGLFGKAPSKFNLAMKTYYTTPATITHDLHLSSIQNITFDVMFLKR